MIMNTQITQIKLLTWYYNSGLLLTWYYTSGLLNYGLFLSTLVVQWCFLQQWVAMEDGWVQKHCMYRTRTKKRRVFEILVPNPAFPKADIQKSSHGGITQWLSGLRRTGSDPFVMSHSTTLILTTRRHRCHRFSAPNERCSKFKAPSTISAFIIIHSSDGIFSSTTQEIQRKPEYL